jgi:chemotaxis protein MotA
MELMTISGLVFGLACVVVVMERAGILHMVLNFDAFLLVFGGTFASMMITYPWALLKQVPWALGRALFPGRRESASDTILTMVCLAEAAKRGGVDSLEGELGHVKEPFLADGLRMVINGVSPELVRESLEKTIAFTRARHQQVADVFKTLGTYSPVFGLLGTLIGVVQILQNLTDAASLGKAMAVAVTTTFYGIFGTNFIFLPLAGKLTAYSDAEILTKQVMIEGILAVQAQEVPALLSLKLQAYMSHRLRERQERPAPSTVAAA